MMHRTFTPWLLVTLLLALALLAGCSSTSTEDGELPEYSWDVVAGQDTWPDGCVPACEGRVCGPNGCGGSCGECTGDRVCDEGACVPGGPCTPDCTGKECGDDGCGGECGVCDLGVPCVAGVCDPNCVANCVNRECGDDGCGGSCGTCPEAAPFCNAQYMCVQTCTANCAGKECGDDGCGGSCGDCPLAAPVCTAQGKCEAEGCTPQCAGKNCGDDACGGSCGTCQGGQSCQNGTCQDGPCVPNCNGKVCGTDGCDGSCGDCLFYEVCQGGMCVCAPDCAGKDCGDDGCGASCGTCPAGQFCEAGTCAAPPCAIESSIGCDALVSGDTAGGQDVYNEYTGSFDCGDFNVGGPERIYSFSTSQTVLLKAWLTDDMQGNLYLMSECDPTTCIDGDFSEVTFNTGPGQTFYLVIEGSNGATSDYTLHTLCLDPGDCPAGKIKNCSDYCTWGHWYQDGMCNSEFNCPELSFDGGDCD